VNGPDIPVQSIPQNILGKQSVANFLGLDARQFRPLAECPKHGKADRSNPGAQIERLLYRWRFLQRVPRSSGIIDAVAVSIFTLENPVRTDQTRNK
jgi:hypothetical protein